MSFLYALAQCTWGLPQTLVGAVFFLLNIKRPHYVYKGAIVTEWKSRSSISLGLFVFVTDEPFSHYPCCRDAYDKKTFGHMLLVHEYGHTIQSLIFGPLYLLLVGVPSVVWCFVPSFAKKRKNNELTYFSVYPENQANRLGEAVTKEKSPAKAVVAKTYSE